MGEDGKPGASEADAAPDTGERTRPETPMPGETPGTSEVDARPDRPVTRDEPDAP